VCVCVCVGEIISLPWFSKKLKTTYRRTTGFLMSSLYFSFANQYSLGGGFPFTIVLMSSYKLFLCHTPIKPDLLGFPGIGVFMCGLRDHEVRIIWYQSLAPLIRLYPFENFVSCCFRKIFLFLLLLDFAAYEKIKNK